MGKIIATCGHEVKSMEEALCIERRAFNREGKRTVSYEMICTECGKEAEAAGEVIHSKEEWDAWMDGGKRENNRGIDTDGHSGSSADDDRLGHGRRG